MSDDQSLLDLLACPKCHGKLARIGSSSTPAPALRGGAPDGFACERCALFFAVEDGLPNMLIEEAKAWPQAKSEAGRA
jgi:uncharacterized protein YbaR (Trm112 family)